MEQFTLFGVNIHRVGTEQALDKVQELMKSNKQSYITTPNPEMIMEARENSEFKQVLNGSDLAAADGMGLVWSSGILGERLPERVAGSDLMLSISRLAAEKNWPVFLLGASDGIADQAAKKLMQQLEDLQVVGSLSGDPQQEHDQSMRDQINQLVGDRKDVILFVAYGAPKQEMWISRNLQQLTHIKLAMGVGGTFDFIAGAIPRAPRWMRSIGLEWLYRLSRQPSRIRRILRVWKFGFLVLLARFGLVER